MINKIKHITLLLLLTLSCTATQTQGIHFETGDWETIQKKAKESNQLIFVDVYTTWCGPCKAMDKNVFSTKTVGDYFNNNFISYKIDAEKGAGINFAKKYNVISYPTLLILDHTGKLVLKGGSKDIEGMLAFGKKALNSEKEERLMNTTYANGDRSPEFMLKYLAFLKEKDLPTEKIMLEYLAAVNKEEWLNQKNLKLMTLYIQTPYNVAVDYIERKNDTIKSDRFVSVLLDKVYFKYLPQLKKQEAPQEEVNKLLTHASSRYDTSKMAYLTFLDKMFTAKYKNDWDSYTKLIIAYVNTYLQDQPVRLNSYAWVFYKNEAITDPKVLNIALSWMNRALDKEKNNYYYLDTKAALLYKLKRKEEALKFVNKAIEIAEGNASSETLELLEKINNL